MKRNIASALIAVIVVALTAVLPAQTAQAWEWETLIFEGTVTRPNGTPVPNIKVSVDCLNGVWGDTNSKGQYHIEGSAHSCLGNTIAVYTSIKYSPNLAKNDAYTLLDGTSYTTTSSYKINKADITMGVRTIPIPEYGWLGGAVAASAGIGALAYVRRIQLAKKI